MSVGKIVNTSVISSPTKSTLLNWTILQVAEDMHTFTDFFNITVKPRMDGECQLLSAHVGSDKNTLDAVDVSLPNYASC